MNFKNLRDFVRQVEKKYGRKALQMRVEVHNPENCGKDRLWIPQDLSFLGVATYPEDKENEYPKETVVVIR